MTRRVFKGQHISSSGTEVLRDGAIAVDLSLNELYLHDGSTAGGVKLAIPKVVNSSFQQVSTDLITFDTFDVSEGKVAEYKVYVAGSDSAYPVIGTATEIVYFTLTVLHDGTNLTLIKSNKYDTGSNFLVDFTATISGTTVSIKAQSNTTYNTVKCLKTVY